jgi:glycerol-3-phosphate acyltransferase PlsY
MVELIAATCVAYFLGSVPFGLVLTRMAGLGDIRSIGSGSIGATNVLRTGSKALAAATLLLDGLKGAVAVWLGLYVAGADGEVLCGVAAVLGHLFPVWLNFRGGKGVATGAGVLLAASPFSGLVCGAIWLAMAVLSKISSTSSLSAVALSPLVVWLITDDGRLALMAVTIAVPIVIRHHANIRRLVSGTEPKIGQK